MHAERAAAGTESEQAYGYLAALDDPLAELVRAIGPIDPYGARYQVELVEPLEWLTFAITGQQISTLAAAAIYRRVVLAVGGHLDPEAILATSDEDLRAAGLSRAKVNSLHALAGYVTDGRITFARFGALGDDEIEKELTAVPGIGPWSAEMFLLRFLQRPDVFPAGDLGIRGAVARLDGLEKVTEQQARRRSEGWRPWRSYATFYLWMGPPPASDSDAN